MIKHNKYGDLKNPTICLSCGFVVQNPSKNGRNKHCSLQKSSIPGERPTRSPCQMFADRAKAKINRKRRIAETEKIEREVEAKQKKQLAMRECLGRLCTDLPREERMFLSKHKFNRKCNRCSNALDEGLPIRTIKFRGVVIEGGIQNKYIPTQISYSRVKD